MDEKRLIEARDAFGLEPELPALVLSRLNDRREALMAATPKLWGMSLWINGETYVLLDEKGYVASTKNVELALRLIKFESTLGPGAVRTLLARPIVDPVAAIFIAESKKRLPLPPNTPTGEHRAQRALNPQVFADLLKQL